MNESSKKFWNGNHGEYLDGALVVLGWSISWQWMCCYVISIDCDENRKMMLFMFATTVVISFLREVHVYLAIVPTFHTFKF